MTSAQLPGQLWTPARVYTAYRIFLACGLAAAFFVTQPVPLIGRSDPALFKYSVLIYLALTVLSGLLLSASQRRFPQWHSLLPVAADIIMLTLLMHASGGIKGNLSVLLMVTVAAASILLPGRGGLFVAALATMAVMFEQFWFALRGDASDPLQLSESGILGIAFFFTALIIQQIARRLAQSEALSATQQQEISRLEALNRQIVHRMRTGIVVFDQDARIAMANRSAQDLAVPASLDPGQPLPASLRQSWLGYRSSAQKSRNTIRIGESGSQVLVRFAELDDSDRQLTLAFLEDQRVLAQEAQQLKLASLGRMSATIAHEIRNPLSAINHAAGLLADTNRDDSDKRLLDIIFAHVKRVNRIIDDVLSLSRRQQAAAELFSLLEFLSERRRQWSDAGINVQLKNIRSDIQVRFDRQQLTQVLDNLVRNAIMHGNADTLITLSAGKEAARGLPWLSVSDNGPGISEEAREHLFEPFFTTNKQGTGLGLFLCREMCESNQAWLDYEPDDTVQGANFVITFAHPERIFE